MIATDLRFGLFSGLLFWKQRKIFGVAFSLHFFDGDKAQCRRVDGVTPAGGRWPVVKDVAEMRIASGRADFGALHPEGGIVSFVNPIVRDRFGKRGPAGAGVEFIGRTEKRFVRNRIHVNARLEVVPIFVAKSRLGAAFAHDPILVLFELRAQNGIARHWFQVIKSAGPLFQFLLMTEEKEAPSDGERADDSQP